MKYAPAPRNSGPIGQNDRLMPAAMCGGDR